MDGDTTRVVVRPEGIPTCDTGPIGRYGFVFRKILAMVVGRHTAGGKK
jgi:hypothetical protein